MNIFKLIRSSAFKEGLALLLLNVALVAMLFAMLQSITIV